MLVCMHVCVHCANVLHYKRLLVITGTLQTEDYILDDHIPFLVLILILPSSQFWVFLKHALNLTRLHSAFPHIFIFQKIDDSKGISFCTDRISQVFFLFPEKFYAFYCWSVCFCTIHIKHLLEIVRKSLSFSPLS